MSTRALRKAQRAREHNLETSQSHAESSSDEEDLASRASKPSAFAMLSEVGNDEEEEEEEDDDGSAEDANTQVKPHTDANAEVDETSKPNPTTSRKKKKKKKKQKPKETTKQAAGLDEIDAALRSLSTTETGSGLPAYNADIANEIFASESALLSVDQHHLQVANEMKRVFGRAAFTADQEERADRRNHLTGEQLGLADAVSGRAAVGGPGLPALLRRRNMFVQGKEEWPRNTSNGLTMQVEHADRCGITTYRFVHSQQYRMSQLNFAQCVATMDPSNMVNTLRFYPYHVATLLQVSEIAKQEKDYATAGELLERALFAFGKALHPTFADAMAKGKARLDFRRPENREFFLAASRYIGNIGMRATWRTAFEWAKFMLALDPENDPYCMRLTIDQLALRARQPQALVDLTGSKMFGDRWARLPNIQYSRSLALRVLDQTSQRSSSMLQAAVRKWPWVAATLFQQLDLGKAPPAIWGRTAATEKDVLYCELYAILGQDVWKLPDAMRFIENSVSGLSTHDTEDPAHHTDPITLDEARFVILTDKPPLIGHVPRDLTNKIDSMSDPLPPEDSIREYDIATIDRAREEPPSTLIEQDPRRFIGEMMDLQQFFEQLVPNFAEEDGLADENIDRVLENSMVGIPEMRRRIGRLMEFRTALSSRLDERLEVDGAELRMANSGRIAQYTPAAGETEPTLFGLDPENASRIEREIEEEMRTLRAREEAESAEGQ